MAVTSYSHGVAANFGFRTHTNAWNTTNTGVAHTTGDMFESPLAGFPRTTSEGAENNAATGGVGVRWSSIKTREGIIGQVPAYLGFNTLAIARMIACVHGDETTAQVAATTAYTHTFGWARSSSYVGCLVATDALRLREIAMCKPFGYEVRVVEGEITQIIFDVVGKREIVDGSGSNTLGAYAGTLPAKLSVPYAMLDNSAVRIAAASGGALGSGDLRYPSTFNFHFRRAYNTGRRTALNAPYIDEPVGGAWIDMGGEFQFTIDDTTGDWAWLRDRTPLKADIVFDSGVDIDGGNNWKLTWELPEIVPNTDGLPDLDTEDILTPSIPFTCEQAASAPTGMSVTLPTFTWQNDSTADHATNET